MQLSNRDVASMVRLVGEVATLSGGHARKKRVLMESLCGLIGADAWAWTLSCERDPKKPQIYVSFLNGGFSEERLARVLQAIEHPEMVEIAASFFHEIERKKTHLTRLRFQITTPERFVNSGADHAWKAANIGPTILSLRPLDERSSSVVAFYRQHGRDEFSARDLRIAHIILSEVPWLHEQGWPEDRGAAAPQLSKRQRLALNLLSLGQGAKQIATHMNISTHTAQGYIKDVYRIFGIHSQAELMHRFFKGDGGEVT